MPRPHQLVAIKFGKLTNGCFILADQQRVGKSVAALLYVMSQNWERVLIISPSKVCPVWQKMVEMISDIPTKIIRKGETLEEGKINICSYDTLHTIEDLSCSICIADECHFFLKSKARRSIAVNRVVADKRIALSATPTMNKVEDMVTILKWVNPQLAKEIEPLTEQRTYYYSDSDLYEQAKILGVELKRRILLLRETHQVGKSIEPFINYIDIDKEINDPKDLQEIGRVKALYALEYIRSFTNKMVVIFYYKATGEQLKVRLGSEAV